jgi:CDP-glucose 4,6-dehydratase
MNFQSFYKDKRVLVTGHTGFKGSWLTEWLLTLGAKVTGLALPPATDPALFDQLGLAERCDYRIGDIRDRALVRKVIHDVRPDLIFHLAAQPLVRLSYAQPLETYETNVMGTAHVLDALRDADWPCAAVMITTDKVYENHEQGRAYQESDPLGGYDPYSSSKACAELVIQTYRNSFFNPAKIASHLTSHALHLTPHNASHLTLLDASRLTSHISPPLVGVASARAGNVIGGGDWAQDRIVPDCMRALAKKEVIAVRNPNATRPWQHVLEPLAGYLLLGMKLHGALTSDISRLTSYSSAFNFGPELKSNRPVLDLVEEILKHWPGRWADGSEANAPHEAGLLNLSVDKAAHILGWHPRWGFERTLAATVDWYKASHDQGGRQVPALTRCQIEEYMT